MNKLIEKLKKLQGYLHSIIMEPATKAKLNLYGKIAFGFAMFAIKIISSVNTAFASELSNLCIELIWFDEDKVKKINNLNNIL